MSERPPSRAAAVAAWPLTWWRLAARTARLAVLGLLLSIISRLSREVVSGPVHWGTIATAAIILAVLASLPFRCRRDWPRTRAHLALLLGGAAMWFTFAGGFVMLDRLISERPADRTPWETVAQAATGIGSVTLVLASLLLFILQHRRRPVPAGRCPGCGYDLRGLPEPRCPECGRPFECGADEMRGDAPSEVSRPLQQG